MTQAIKERASDIHFEPFETEFKIRYRVDGALYEMAPPPVHLANPVISRIKVMANMNIAERRIPQDGRIMTVVNGKPVDMRVNSLPTQHGESVVLRVLDRSSVNLDLDSLACQPSCSTTSPKPSTSPTASSSSPAPPAPARPPPFTPPPPHQHHRHQAAHRRRPGRIRARRHHAGAVNDAVGLTFAKALRAFLRQDPDRIMVGEMRDVETAQIAIQASLTGHLVLSTLHTNDAAGAVTRLVDMGVEPFLVSATLEGVLAQRLLRTICKACRAPYDPASHPQPARRLAWTDLGGKQFYTGGGCSICGNSGYKGRKGIYELLDVTDPIRDLITEKAPTLVLKQKAIELGMDTLREDGLRNIYDGETTIEEVLKYT
jgi:type IV pilus assembly protein PilB